MTPNQSPSKLLAITAGQLICGAMLLSGCLSGRTATTPPPAVSEQQRGTSGVTEGVNPKAAAIQGFMERVNEYIKIQKRVDDDLPKLRGDETPSEIEVHQAAMSARLKLARKTAKPGDIFGDAAPIFKALIRQDEKFRTLRDERAAMEEVPKYDPPAINAAYPVKSPLATVPPLLLDLFPRLPEGVEYRFMGRDLILRDVRANVIADFINEAIAPLKDGK